MAEQSEVAAVLNKAASLVEQGWTQGDWAVDSAGHPVDVHNREACAWCLNAAVVRARDTARHIPEWGPIQRAVTQAIGSSMWARWNDAPGRTQAEVVAALRQAAELAS